MEREVGTCVLLRECVVLIGNNSETSVVRAYGILRQHEKHTTHTTHCTTYNTQHAGAGFKVPERLVEVEVVGATNLPTMHLWTSASCQLELASALLDNTQWQVCCLNSRTNHFRIRLFVRLLLF